MTNRKFDDAVEYREMIREYLDTHRSHSFEGAYGYVMERCAEQGIKPPHSSTVRRILKSMNYVMRLVRS